VTWNASQILWQEQLIVLLILLPPIFFSSILVALNAPRLFARKQMTRAKPTGELSSPARPARAVRGL
jgi:hypothetical protein